MKTVKNESKNSEHNYHLNLNIYSLLFLAVFIGIFLVRSSAAGCECFENKSTNVNSCKDCGFIETNSDTSTFQNKNVYVAKKVTQVEPGQCKCNKDKCEGCGVVASCINYTDCLSNETIRHLIKLQHSFEFYNFFLFLNFNRSLRSKVWMLQEK